MDIQYLMDKEFDRNLSQAITLNKLLLWKIQVDSANLEYVFQMSESKFTIMWRAENFMRIGESIICNVSRWNQFLLLVYTVNEYLQNPEVLPSITSMFKWTDLVFEYITGIHKKNWTKTHACLYHTHLNVFPMVKWSFKMWE